MFIDNKTLMLMHQERLDEAAKSRLANEMIEANRETNKGTNPTLAWFGRRMIDIGAKMANIPEDRKPSLN